MKRPLSYIFLILSIAAVILLLLAIVPSTPYGIWVSGHDAGQVGLNSTFSHTFTIYNLTRHSVLMSTFPTCGCTTAELMRVHVPGFVHRAVTVSINTEGIRPGRHTRQVILFFESGSFSWHQIAAVDFVVKQSVPHK